SYLTPLEPGRPKVAVATPTLVGGRVSNGVDTTSRWFIYIHGTYVLRFEPVPFARGGKHAVRGNFSESALGDLWRAVAHPSSYRWFPDRHLLFAWRRDTDGSFHGRVLCGSSCGELGLWACGVVCIRVPAGAPEAVFSGDFSLSCRGGKNLLAPCYKSCIVRASFPCSLVRPSRIFLGPRSLGPVFFCGFCGGRFRSCHKPWRRSIIKIMQEGVSSTASVVLFLEKLVVDPLVRPVLWGVFLFGLFLWGVMTWILLYHWKSYSFDQQKIRGPKRLYLYVSAVLILLMFASLISFSL
ncbi:MAG: hypothetical protein UY56_C0015G0001, partial [Parcubacteria group bacterium GW2011_GWA1_50_14]